MDFGALVDGYHTDMTRTVAFGEPAPELRKVHDLVAAAQQAGIDALRPGASAADVDRAARSVIEDAGYGDVQPRAGTRRRPRDPRGPVAPPRREDVIPAGAVVTSSRALPPGSGACGSRT